MLRSLLRSFGLAEVLGKGVGASAVRGATLHVGRSFRPFSAMAGVTLEERGTPNTDDYRIYYRE